MFAKADLLHSYTKKDFSLKEDLRCQCLVGGVIFPSISWGKLGVTDFSLNGLGKTRGTTAMHEWIGPPVTPYPVSENDIITDHRTVIFLGSFYYVYGHCITDNIKRTWFLKTKEGRKLMNDGADLVFLNCVPGMRMPQYQKEIFMLLGIDIRKMEEIKVVTRFDRIYVPDNSIVYEPDTEFRFYHNAFYDCILHIIDEIKKERNYPEKIYFSRSMLSTDKDIGKGEQHIEHLFQKAGYQIIHPELLSFKEQVNMLSHCKYFAATEGSISHNVIFCRPNTIVTIIRKCYWVNSYQLIINQMSSVRTTYIDAHHSVVNEEAPWLGPFFIWPNTELKRNLNVNGIILPYWLSFSYYQYLLVLFKETSQNKFPYLYKIAKRIKLKLS